MKMFTLFLFSVLFIPFTSYSQNKVQSEDTELKEDLLGREEYYKLKHAELPPFAYSEAVKQRESMVADINTFSKTSTTNWVSLDLNGQNRWRLGGYLSGRTNSVAFDPTDSSIVYIGAANGGVWKTLNGGINWSPLTDGLTSLACGDVAVDQRNPNIVYFASGEQNYAGDCNTGDGLFKSLDAGATWLHIADATTTGTSCTQFSIDPVNSNIVYWAGDLGVMKSTNGGIAWNNTNAGSPSTSIFINSTANLGTAVGSSGKIRRTTDGGVTWTAQTSNTTENLNGVYFIDANIGTIVGTSGKILRTINGGTNWTSQTSGTTNYLQSVYFYNANKGWAVGNYGTILYTANGGTTWTAQTSGTPTIHLNGVSFSDSIHGWAVGASGTILFTANGGTNWTAQTSGTTNTLYDVSFTNAINGTAVGNSGKILRTTNGGTNWSSQTSGVTNHLYGVTFYSTKIGKVVGTSGKILCTTNGGTNWISQTSGTTENLWGVSFTDPMTGSATGTNGKILRTIDGGITWTSQTSGEIIQFNAVQFIYNDTKILVTAIGTANSTIKKSTNAGSTWTTIDNGISTSNRGLIRLAPYRQDFNIFYASVVNSSNSGLLGLYKTTNLGVNWNLQQSSNNYLGNQGRYDNSVLVKNSDPNAIFVGGIDPWKSTDAGVNLIEASGDFDTLHYVHCDIHRFEYRGYVLYCLSDGGVYKTTNDGQTWINLNKTLSTLQYQNADYAMIDNNKFRGGSQDNGLLYTNNGGTTWQNEGPGDGAYVCFDQVDTSYSYNAGNQGGCQRWHGLTYPNVFYIAPSGSTGGLFYPPLKIAPGDNNTLFYGRASLWKTTSAKTCTTTSGWTKIDSVTSPVYTMGISFTNTSKFYYAAAKTIKATANNGSSWVSQTLTDNVWDIVVDNTNDNIAYACLQGGTNKVAKTINGGASWTYINGTLPAIPYNSIVLRTSPSRMLFVASDVGVFQSTNDGATWVSFNNGLPVVPVYDLKYYQTSNKLMAATHGRGCWMFDLSGLGKDIFAEIPLQFSLSENYPNPFNPQTHIQFDIPVADNVKLTVYDLTGSEIETLVNNRLNAGKFEVTFDGSKYASGVYLYRLTVGNSYSSTKKMILLK